MNSEVYKRKLDTLYELLAYILDLTGPINVCEYQLRRSTRDLRTRVAKCTEVVGEIFEHLKIAYVYCLQNGLYDIFVNCNWVDNWWQ